MIFFFFFFFVTNSWLSLELDLRPTAHLVQLKEAVGKKSELLYILRQHASHLSTSLCHISRLNLTLVTNLCRPQPLLAQDILISSFVVGLLFHKGRGLVSGMLCEHFSVPLRLRLTSPDSNRLRLTLHTIYLLKCI